MQFDQVAFDFSGLRALVVGGSRGIGRGVVQGLVAAGAEVAYAARAPAEPPVDGAVHVRVELRDAASIAAASSPLGWPPPSPDKTFQKKLWLA